MDLTAPAVAETEHFDSPSKIDQIATRLASLIQNSNHFIVFTGAGVSTSAGIPDFRGPEGAWTKRAQGKELEFKASATLEAVPTPTHMALVALQEQGLLKEYCKDCGKEYIRDFRAVSTYEKSYSDHRTGRKCSVPTCNGFLHDTIINFGEDLPEQAFSLAADHAKKADLCLVLGSSCRVTPANSIPEAVGRAKKARLAICNLQSTPLERIADKTLRAHARTDDLMTRIMGKLGIEIPRFILRRRLVIEMQSQRSDRHQIKVFGVDVDGTPVSFIQSVKLEGSRRALKTEPFVLSLREELDVGAAVKLELEFMGHYGEPNLVIEHEYAGEGSGAKLYLLEYDPLTKEWRPKHE
ncbi:hypothetical protein N0V90_002801 [Kalmusia sp. IMI 367209]|nr:hypothetical protein N0V90_002801 [Kalmusia sp. IMI 367209]